MIQLKVIIKPLTAFGTPIVGDTLFGQLCWAIVERYGEDKLRQCLDGYTDGLPFMVVSDAMPAGYLPLPTLPSAYWEVGDETDRKVLKKRQWIAETDLAQDSKQWQQIAKADKELVGQERHLQMHNSINRETHTTSAGNQFAPYSMEQIWFTPDSEWQVYILLDESKLSIDELKTLWHDMAVVGYGRDASIGLGKFDVVSIEPTDLFTQNTQGNAVMTLARSCPQGLGIDSRYSFYNVETRFGRHGNLQANAGQPFKQPILMAKTAAVFATQTSTMWIGQGISGVSHSQPETVHQGYAPVIAFQLDTERIQSLCELA